MIDPNVLKVGDTFLNYNGHERIVITYEEYRELGGVRPYDSDTIYLKNTRDERSLIGRSNTFYWQRCANHVPLNGNIKVVGSLDYTSDDELTAEDKKIIKEALDDYES